MWIMVLANILPAHIVSFRSFISNTSRIILLVLGSRREDRALKSLYLCHFLQLVMQAQNTSGPNDVMYPPPSFCMKKQNLLCMDAAFSYARIITRPYNRCRDGSVQRGRGIIQSLFIVCKSRFMLDHFRFIYFTFPIPNFFQHLSEVSSCW